MFFTNNDLTKHELFSKSILLHLLALHIDLKNFNLQITKIAYVKYILHQFRVLSEKLIKKVVDMFKLLENLVSTLNLEFYFRKFQTKKDKINKKVKSWRSSVKLKLLKITESLPAELSINKQIIGSQ